jgi:diaminopimelate epimerase
MINNLQIKYEDLMLIKFEKFSGAGNDFVIVQNSNFNLEPSLIQKICDRHFGIGADGLLLIGESNKADFSLKYFNSDGTGDVLCVNGARCAVLFAFQKGLCDRECSFEFINQIFRAEIMDESNVRLFIDYSPIIQLNKDIEFLSKKLLTHLVDIKAKHLIIYWDSFCSVFSSIVKESDFEIFDINYFGRLLRNHPEFLPDGVNVNFIKQVEENTIRVRTYERGVEAETLACGSGSIASSIIFYLTQKINPPIKVITTSKKIFQIDFAERNGLFLGASIKGHAQKIFEGLIEL